MSQNNRAFRSNPNKKIMVGKELLIIRHKITEPSAQIPTELRLQIKTLEREKALMFVTK